MQRSLMALVLVTTAAVGYIVARYAFPARSAAAGVKAPKPGANPEAGKTPADLPPSFIREAEFPTGTLEGLTPQQKYTVLKVANEENCTCGCPNDSIAKCRTHDPGCSTAPALLADIIASARKGLSSTEIEAALTASGNKPITASGADNPAYIYQVPIEDSPVRGAPNAKVTLVEFGDFQCPFSSQAQAALEEVRSVYGADLRVVFKQNPLAFHPHAAEAAEAALAAGDQGKFWEMHDLLFQNQQKLEKSDLELDAARLRLDGVKFKAALDSHAHQAQIDRDRALEARLGAVGTPVFFINGHKLVGAQTAAGLEALIGPLLQEARAKLKSGTPPADLYTALTGGGLVGPPPMPSMGHGLQASRAIARAVEVAKFNPGRGPETAPVTLIEFGDFQCPFSARAEPTLRRLRETYGDKLRWVWRNAPLPVHPLAVGAAQAALAAAEQGKFWEMHDALFASAPNLEGPDLEKAAAQAGLDVPRWKARLATAAVAAQVTEDARYASEIGVDGTPTFFVNGKELGGAQPFDAFRAVIDEQLQRAAELAAQKVADDDIAERLTTQNAAASPPVVVSPGIGLESGLAVDLGRSPSRGPADAPVTIVEFSDFACYFCGVADQVLAGMEQLYPNRIRRVFKQHPLAFHPEAELAAEASLAANEQGKFWEMAEVLFQHSTELKRANLDEYAKQVGLNLAKYESALDGHRFKAAVAAEQAQAVGLGFTGTPTFVINGRKLLGAQGPDVFRRLIDAELAQHPASIDGGAAPHP